MMVFEDDLDTVPSALVVDFFCNSMVFPVCAFVVVLFVTVVVTPAEFVDVCVVVVAVGPVCAKDKLDVRIVKATI
jgi:hypothetical protein